LTNLITCVCGGAVKEKEKELKKKELLLTLASTLLKQLEKEAVKKGEL
jgi:hypothetical protein